MLGLEGSELSGFLSMVGASSKEGCSWFRPSCFLACGLVDIDIDLKVIRQSLNRRPLEIAYAC